MFDYNHSYLYIQHSIVIIFLSHSFLFDYNNLFGELCGILSNNNHLFVYMV